MLYICIFQQGKVKAMFNLQRMNSAYYLKTIFEHLPYGVKNFIIDFFSDDAAHRHKKLHMYLDDYELDKNIPTFDNLQWQKQNI